MSHSQNLFDKPEKQWARCHREHGPNCSALLLPTKFQLPPFAFTNTQKITRVQIACWVLHCRNEDPYFHQVQDSCPFTGCDYNSYDDIDQLMLHLYGCKHFNNGTYRGPHGAIIKFMEPTRKRTWSLRNCGLLSCRPSRKRSKRRNAISPSTSESQSSDDSLGSPSLNKKHGSELSLHRRFELSDECKTARSSSEVSPVHTTIVLNTDPLEMDTDPTASFSELPACVPYAHNQAIVIDTEDEATTISEQPSGLQISADSFTPNVGLDGTTVPGILMTDFEVNNTSTNQISSIEQPARHIRHQIQLMSRIRDKSPSLKPIITNLPRQPVRPSNTIASNSHHRGLLNSPSTHGREILQSTPLDFINSMKSKFHDILSESTLKMGVSRAAAFDYMPVVPPPTLKILVDAWIHFKQYLTDSIIPATFQEVLHLVTLADACGRANWGHMASMNRPELYQDAIDWAQNITDKKEREAFLGHLDKVYSAETASAFSRPGFTLDEHYAPPTDTDRHMSNRALRNAQWRLSTRLGAVIRYCFYFLDTYTLLEYQQKTSDQSVSMTNQMGCRTEIVNALIFSPLRRKFCDLHDIIEYAERKWNRDPNMSIHMLRLFLLCDSRARITDDQDRLQFHQFVAKFCDNAAAELKEDLLNVKRYVSVVEDVIAYCKPLTTPPGMGLVPHYDRPGPIPDHTHVSAWQASPTKFSSSKRNTINRPYQDTTLASPIKSRTPRTPVSASHQFPQAVNGRDSVLLELDTPSSTTSNCFYGTPVTATSVYSGSFSDSKLTRKQNEMSPIKGIASKPLPNPPLQCEKCQRQFFGKANNQRSNRSRHMNEQHCEVPIKYPCRDCNKGFTRADNLAAHRNTKTCRARQSDLAS